MKTFSILMPSMHSRKVFYDRMCERLFPQLTSEVEIISSIDSGEVPLAKKINQLYKEATGKYVALVNDDDLLPYDYISTILTAARSDADILLGEIHQWWNDQNFEDAKIITRYENVIPALTELVQRYCIYDENLEVERQDSIVSAKLSRNADEVHLIKKPIYYHLRRRKGCNSPYTFKELE